MKTNAEAVEWLEKIPGPTAFWPFRADYTHSIQASSLNPSLAGWDSRIRFIANCATW